MINSNHTYQAGCDAGDLNPNIDIEKLVNELEEQWGESVTYSKQGVKHVNPGFFADLISKLVPIAYSSLDNTLYALSDDTCVWTPQSIHSVHAMVAKVLLEFGKKYNLEGLHERIGRSRTGDIVAFLPTVCQPFLPPPENACSFIHCGNGFLRWDSTAKDFTLTDMASGYPLFSRCQIPIPYLDDEHCHRFKEELLNPALSEDDQNVLQQYVGQVVVGRNISQSILLITGTAGGGKSSLVNIIEQLAGPANVTELRVGHLGGRFETQRYLGRSLLTAKDVPQDFLRGRSASRLKALVGKDALTVEKKGLNDVAAIIGELNVIVTSNTAQPVRLENDREAWERRLLWIQFANSRPRHPIPDFDRVLLNREGPGILSWAVEGARQVLRNEGINRSEQQRERIRLLLASSDSVGEFVRNEIVRREQSSVTATELLLAYTRFCQSRSWQPETERHFRITSEEQLRCTYGVAKRTDVVREGKNQRGYYGLALRQDDQPARPQIAEKTDIEEETDHDK